MSWHFASTFHYGSPPSDSGGSYSARPILEGVASHPGVWQVSGIGSSSPIRCGAQPPSGVRPAIKLLEAGRFYPSTKLCSGCGAVVDMPLSARVYHCALCGLTLDRDLNAAINLCPVALTPSETLNASGGNVSPGSAWQIPLKLEPSAQAAA